MRVFPAIIVLVLLSGTVQAAQLDLSYAFDSSTIYWPTATPFSLKVVHKGPTPTGFWYESNDFSACEHGGTHMDAPCHFAKGSWTVDAIPLEVLSGPAVVCDISGRCRMNRDYALAEGDVLAWEKEHGQVPAGSIFLLRTGWGKLWPNKKYYLGTDVKGDVKNLHFPSYGAAAAALLMKRQVKMVGLDTASVDIGQSNTYPCHVIFGTANVPALENVANLDRLPATGARLIALPMKIGGGSGGPVRIIAEW